MSREKTAEDKAELKQHLVMYHPDIHIPRYAKFEHLRVLHWNLPHGTNHVHPSRFSAFAEVL